MKVIIFHVERTGGTTLRHILFQRYGWWSGIVYPHYYMWKGTPGVIPFKKTPEVDKASIFIGHAVYYGMHEIIGGDCKYVTFLRDPYKRMESFYNHCRVNDVKAGLPPSTFDQWFAQFGVGSQVWAMCRDDANPTLEKAKNILLKCSFIGLQETFEEDAKQLFYPYEYKENLNSTPAQAEKVGLAPVRFTPEQREKVINVLDDDYELFDFAIRLRGRGHNKDFVLPDVRPELE